MQIKLIAGQETEVAAVGRYFRILSTETADNLQIRIVGVNGEMYRGDVPSGLGIEFSDKQEFPVPFNKIYIYSQSTQSVTLWAELAKADDDRLSGNFDINGAISVLTTMPANHNYSTIAMTGIEVELFPARLTRRAMLVKPSGEITLDTGFVTSSSFEWNTSGALKATGLIAVAVEIFEDFD